MYLKILLLNFLHSNGKLTSKMGSSLKAQKVCVLSSHSLGETIWHEVFTFRASRSHQRGKLMVPACESQGLVMMPNLLPGGLNLWPLALVPGPWKSWGSELLKQHWRVTAKVTANSRTASLPGKEKLELYLDPKSNSWVLFPEARNKASSWERKESGEGALHQEDVWERLPLKGTLCSQREFSEVWSIRVQPFLFSVSKCISVLVVV